MKTITHREATAGLANYAVWNPHSGHVIAWFRFDFDAKSFLRVIQDEAIPYEVVKIDWTRL